MCLKVKKISKLWDFWKALNFDAPEKVIFFASEIFFACIINQIIYIGSLVQCYYSFTYNLATYLWRLRGVFKMKFHLTLFCSYWQLCNMVKILKYVTGLHIILSTKGKRNATEMRVIFFKTTFKCPFKQSISEKYVV